MNQQHSEAMSTATTSTRRFTVQRSAVISSLFLVILVSVQVALFPGARLVDVYRGDVSDRQRISTTTAVPPRDTSKNALMDGGFDERFPEMAEATSAASRKGIRHKPLLLIHIGPPKTATTTLQNGMKELKKHLLKDDNIFYCPFGSKKCGILANKVSWCGVNPNHTASVECWEGVRQEMRRSVKGSNETHFILSAEPMSIGYRWQHHMGRRAPVDWLSVKEQLGKDWRVVIAMGYRRYVDWLPSSDQQIWRWTSSKKSMNAWPGKGGTRMTPLIPTRWKSAIIPQKYTYPHTSHLVENINGTLSVVLFNMHDLGDMFPEIDTAERNRLPSNDKVSLLSRFLCRTLKDAGISTNATCIQSLMIDKSRSKEKIANPSQTLFYDALAVAAFDKQLVPSSSTRHRIAAVLEEFHTTQLNETYRDLPVVCPTQEEYEEFLNHSLAVEAHLLPAFFSTPLGRKAHTENFWTSLAKKKHCWIDSDTVLEKEEWKQFLATKYRQAKAGS